MKIVLEDLFDELNARRPDISSVINNSSDIPRIGLDYEYGVRKRKVNKVIIEHKDRLTRFQFNFIQKMYAVFGCEIIVLDDKEDVSDAEELTRDLMTLVASFSGKYYGRGSLERRKKNKNVE